MRSRRACSRRSRKAKAGFKGEERHERVLAAYRDQDVHPLFAMKSLFGYLIQIPRVYCSLRHAGREHRAGGGTDGCGSTICRARTLFLALPFSIPFFGGDFNLLPLLMTLLSVVAAIRHDRPVTHGCDLSA